MVRNYTILFIVIILYGCDLLTTRDPEKPESPRSTFVSATTPELLFNNLKDSFKEKIVENYMACFVDEALSDKKFSFVPSAGSSAQYTILNDWSLSSERQYFLNLRSQVSAKVPIVLDLQNMIANIQSDSAVYQFDYLLSVYINSEVRSYQGNVQFNIILDSRNFWVVRGWEDIKKQNFSSWSELKGAFHP
ncbi:MAG: hypothetical protein KKG93_08425 [Bacteroidetes bacterium]|nr:hypothetical protein [Bacteroidota bacterium]